MKKLTVILFADALEHKQYAGVVSKIHTKNCEIEIVNCKNL